MKIVKCLYIYIIQIVHVISICKTQGNNLLPINDRIFCMKILSVSINSNMKLLTLWYMGNNRMLNQISYKHKLLLTNEILTGLSAAKWTEKKPKNRANAKTDSVCFWYVDNYNNLWLDFVRCDGDEISLGWWDWWLWSIGLLVWVCKLAFMWQHIDGGSWIPNITMAL